MQPVLSLHSALPPPVGPSGSDTDLTESPEGAFLAVLGPAFAALAPVTDSVPAPEGNLLWALPASFALQGASRELPAFGTPAEDASPLPGDSTPATEPIPTPQIGGDADPDVPQPAPALTTQWPLAAGASWSGPDQPAADDPATPDKRIASPAHLVPSVPGLPSEGAPAPAHPASSGPHDPATGKRITQADADRPASALPGTALQDAAPGMAGMQSRPKAAPDPTPPAPERAVAAGPAMQGQSATRPQQDVATAPLQASVATATPAPVLARAAVSAAVSKGERPDGPLAPAPSEARQIAEPRMAEAAVGAAENAAPDPKPRRISLWEAAFPAQQPLAGVSMAQVSAPTAPEAAPQAMGEAPVPTAPLAVTEPSPPAARTDTAQRPVQHTEAAGPGLADRQAAPANDMSGKPVQAVTVAVPFLAQMQASAAALAVVALAESQETRLPTEASGLAGPGASTSSGGLTAPGPAQALSAPVAQLAAALLVAGPDTIELALSPEELGKVRLQLQVDGQDPGRMVVMLSFERPETMDLFRRHADQLAEVIRSAGYDSVDIGFSQQGGQHADHGGKDSASGNDAAPTEDPYLPGELSPRPAQNRLQHGAAGLDLRL